MKRIILMAAVAFAFVGCAKPAATPPVSSDSTPPVADSAASAGVISIKGFAFSPASTTVTVGTAVTWTNNDSFAHTVTSVAGSPASFDSASLGAGKSFTFTFVTPGTYSYVCDFHGQMTGTVIVE